MKQLAVLALFCAVAAGVDFETYCKPTKEIGPCKAGIPRWWFNVKSGQCEKFLYGGCRGNKNNYVNMQECEKSCLRRLSALDVSAEVHYPEHWNETKYSHNVTSEYFAAPQNYES
ncbi:kunitz-type serine protease inhibitor 6 [Rhipicephalus sanguineus]|uniref:kunitz-type serine protease inhibitor 6 n=1 Tax=Rhipicephalus sanguineus TaxID=34632 RepID=UPI0020C5ADB6|nr:kunitz-type serine protease inhibitor 6 [Rhipicephalus sanguineus]